jgi:hypothetical protein
MRFEDKHVAQPGKGGIVRYDAGQSYLLVVLVNAKAERVLDSALGHVQGTPLRPIRHLAEPGVDQVKVQPRRVRADQIAVSFEF